MSDYSFTGILAFVTLGIVAVAAIVYYVWFTRKSENRHPMDTPAGHAAEEERRQAAEHAREDEGPRIPSGQDPAPPGPDR